MHQTARSIFATNIDGTIIEIECHVSNGLPGIIIVGLGNKVVDESKERLRSAFASSSLELPRKRITINLAPADIPKDSTSFDLAIAAAIMSVANPEAVRLSLDQAILGEIGLNGDIRPIRGIIGKLIAGKQLGMKSFVIPYGNLQQASLLPDTTLYPIKNLRELFELLTSGAPTVYSPGPHVMPFPPEYDCYLSDVVGQEQAKRALTIAAAGGHNILLSGPPGTGKSMLAKALPSLMPPMTHDEIIETTHLYSLATLRYDELITARPFRAPHHSASHAAMVGGGNIVRPGEISLSHCGVLFLDEMPEYSRQTIEALRQPLEDHTITIARAKQTVNFPARFMLVGTANPCPCGYLGSDKDCICTASKIITYQRKLSGPILDRIDMFVQVNALDHTKLLTARRDPKADTEASRRVAAARHAQYGRYGSTSTLNSTLTSKELQRFACVSDKAKLMIDMAASSLKLSPRAYLRTIKVARTIADLANSPTILDSHISEALQYRKVANLVS